MAFIPNGVALYNPFMHLRERCTKHFTKIQEGVRKDVERAFGILQAWWGIIKNLICVWDLETITNIMMACIIMHNMILNP